MSKMIRFGGHFALGWPKRWPWEHSHVFVPVQAEMTPPSAFAKAFGDGQDHTTVTERCACGEIRQRALTGRVTLDVLLGKSTTEVVDDLISGVK